MDETVTTRPVPDEVRKRRLLLLVAITTAVGLMAVVVRSGGDGTVAAPGQPGGPPLAAGSASATYQVASVTDAVRVTLTAGGQKQDVRLIGVAVPSGAGTNECFSKETTAEAHRLLDGATVTLITDPQHSEIDAEGRAPAYLVLPDGRYYDTAMASGGFVMAPAGPPDYLRKGEVQAAQDQAKKAKRGLWAVPGCGQ